MSSDGHRQSIHIIDGLIGENSIFHGIKPEVLISEEDNAVGCGNGLLGRLFQGHGQRVLIETVLQFYEENRLRIRLFPVLVVGIAACHIHTFIGGQKFKLLRYQARGIVEEMKACTVIGIHGVICLIFLHLLSHIAFPCPLKELGIPADARQKDIFLLLCRTSFQPVINIPGSHQIAIFFHESGLNLAEAVSKESHHHQHDCKYRQQHTHVHDRFQFQQHGF